MKKFLRQLIVGLVLGSWALLALHTHAHSANGAHTNDCRVCVQAKVFRHVLPASAVVLAAPVATAVVVAQVQENNFSRHTFSTQDSRAPPR